MPTGARLDIVKSFIQHILQLRTQRRPAREDPPQTYLLRHRVDCCTERNAKRGGRTKEIGESCRRFRSITIEVPRHGLNHWIHCWLGPCSMMGRNRSSAESKTTLPFRQPPKRTAEEHCRLYGQWPVVVTPTVSKPGLRRGNVWFAFQIPQHSFPHPQICIKKKENVDKGEEIFQRAFRKVTVSL